MIVETAGIEGKFDIPHSDFELNPGLSLIIKTESELINLFYLFPHLEALGVEFDNIAVIDSLGVTPKEDLIPVVERLQNITRRGGINFITDYINTDKSNIDSAGDIWQPYQNEDWQIIHTDLEEGPMKERDQNGHPKRVLKAMIVARKIADTKQV